MTKRKIQLPISWRAPEYSHNQKSSDWFWIVGIFTLALLVVSITFSNMLFAIFILLAGFTIILYGARKPRLVQFSITGRGILIGKNLYPYNTLKSFWIHYDPPFKKELVIQSEKILMPYIKIPLGDIDPNAVREILLKFLKEKEQEESLIDAVSDYLRF
jgi:uncharacterized membrane protein